VRSEHAFVEEAAYRVGRARVLAAFLAKDRIYAVPAIAAQREARARAHLAATLDALRSEEESPAALARVVTPRRTIQGLAAVVLDDEQSGGAEPTADEAVVEITFDDEP
jgi:hypothetical protein